MQIRQLSNQAGATMVEFSLIVVLMLALVTGTFDIAMLLRSHSLLTTATQHGARAVSTQYFANQSIAMCEQVEGIAAIQAQEHLSKFTGQSSSDMEFVPEIQFRETFSGEHVSYLVLEGQLKARCFFCFAVPGGIQLAARSEAVMEDPAFYCIKD